MKLDKQLQAIQDEYLSSVQKKVKQRQSQYENSLITTGQLQNEALNVIQKDLPTKIYKKETSESILEQALGLMNNIADADVSSYIMDKLSIDEIVAFVINFDDILEKLKKIGSNNFTRESLLKYIQTYAKKEGFTKSNNNEKQKLLLENKTVNLLDFDNEKTPEKTPEKVENIAIPDEERVEEIGNINILETEK